MEYLKEIAVTFFVSMLPVLELRAALPLGVSLGLDCWTSLAVSIVGNVLPVPFVILFSRRIFEWLRTKSELLERFVQWQYRKAMANKERIYEYKVLGLMLFVAIPLPGTGAWTGAIIAAILNIRIKTALPAIMAGVLIAGLIVCGITFGFTKMFAF